MPTCTAELHPTVGGGVCDTMLPPELGAPCTNRYAHRRVLPEPPSDSPAGMFRAGLAVGAVPDPGAGWVPPLVRARVGRGELNVTPPREERPEDMLADLTPDRLARLSSDQAEALAAVLRTLPGLISSAREAEDGRAELGLLPLRAKALVRTLNGGGA